MRAQLHSLICEDWAALVIWGHAEGRLQSKSVNLQHNNKTFMTGAIPAVRLIQWGDSAGSILQVLLKLLYRTFWV